MITLEEICGYLPYGLRVKHTSKKGNIRKEAILTISDFTWLFRQGYFKPILRPLSDLTKEIEVNGEKFVPKKELEKVGYLPTNMKEYLYLAQANLLYKWHFDIYGLIERNLAIDINTL